MRFKQYIEETTSMKLAAKKAGLLQRHEEEQARKRAEMLAKYDNGEPVKIMLDVYAGKSLASGDVRWEKREFTIDNKLDIRHKLADIKLIDLAKVDHNARDHTNVPTYSIYKNNKHVEGSIPQYLHGFPPRTKKKQGFAPEDLRREAYEANTLKLFKNPIKHFSG